MCVCVCVCVVFVCVHASLVDSIMVVTIINLKVCKHFAWAQHFKECYELTSNPRSLILMA